MRTLIGITMAGRCVMLCLILAGLWGAPALGAQREDVEGEVIQLQGQAWVQREVEGAEIPLAVRDLLHAGDTVRTAEVSEVQIRMADGSILRVRPRSLMKMNDRRLTDGAGSSVALFLGRLWCQVTSLTKGRSFHVDTPTVVAGVRGTQYEVGAFDDGTALVAVEEGTVQVEAAGKEMPVPAGQAMEVEYDAPPQKPFSFDSSARAWEGWGERRMKRIPVVLPPLTQKMHQRISQGMEISRRLHKEILEQSNQVRQLMEEAAELKAQKKWQRLKQVRDQIMAKRAKIMVLLQRLEKVDNRLAAAGPMVKKVHSLAEQFREPLGAQYRVVMERIRSLQQQAAMTRQVRQENRRAMEENRRRILELREVLKEGR